MAPVLLTGATGFIGRRIQRALLASGQPVRALLRPGSRNPFYPVAGCEAVVCDLTDRVGLEQAVRDARAIVYCAGSVRGRSLEDFRPANVAGVETLLQAREAAPVPMPFLLISSLAAGRPELSDYAHSKSLGEEAVRKRAAAPWTVLRPPAVYGPGDREMRPILRMARRGLVFHAGPRSQRVSLIHADDLAAAVVAWLEAWQACSGATYAIDDGHPGGYGWEDLARAAGGTRFRAWRVPPALLGAIARVNLAVSGVAGYAPMFTPGKVRELTEAGWLCDNTAFELATGWRPRIRAETGIPPTLEPL